MRIWVVDAFTDRAFTGNPAAVVPLEGWLPDATLQAIAAENRVSQTAFVVPTGLRGNFQLRWFTSSHEVDMSGHATLAAGAVVLGELEKDLELVVFDTQTGALVVRKTRDGYTLDLPRRTRKPWQQLPAELSKAIGGARVIDAFTADYAVLVLDSEDAVRGLRPDIGAINRLVRGPRQGCLSVTAAAEDGKPYDFVSRFFAPGLGVPEDPVTGAAFADLAPYWCDRFDLDSVVGFQASRRGGFVRAIQTLTSVRLLGHVAIYMRGEIDPAVARIHNLASGALEPLPRAPKVTGPAALAPIFDNPPIVASAGPAAASASEPRRVVVVTDRGSRQRKLDDDLIVRLVKEADVADSQTIHVYEIDGAPDDGVGIEEVVTVQEPTSGAQSAVKVVILGRSIPEELTSGRSTS
ncbi:MAG: PhzF family phenazine biosynthesis protein [Caulobacterales bacterium]|jgi:PhzF family phenazine biosynthesis protein